MVMARKSEYNQALIQAATNPAASLRGRGFVFFAFGQPVAGGRRTPRSR